MIWDEIASREKPFFALAPMNDVTDTVFRQIVARCAAPDVFFTEFVSVDALASSGRKDADEKLQFTDIEQPLIVQVWGNEPKNYEIQTRELASAGYAGIDINMGCPVAKVISRGMCSALIKDRAKAHDIISATQEGASHSSGNFPVSVKTRIGFDEIDLTWIEFLLQHNLACLSVHCRTTKEQSKVPNHFEVLPDIVAMRDAISPETKLIANGDVMSRPQGEKLATRYGVDGIMVGRGIFHDPFVFAHKSPWREMARGERIKIFVDQIELFEKTWQQNKNPEALKKFAKVYVTGFAGAPQVRDQIMRLRSASEVRQFLLSCVKPSPVHC